MEFEKLFESLWKASDREFVNTVRYGIVAVDALGAARHFCGYDHVPTWADREHLLQELRTNESFGLVDVYFVLEEAPSDLILHYLQEQDSYDWEVHDGGKFRRRIR